MCPRDDLNREVTDNEGFKQIDFPDGAMAKSSAYGLQPEQIFKGPLGPDFVIRSLHPLLSH